MHARKNGLLRAAFYLKKSAGIGLAASPNSSAGPASMTLTLSPEERT
jgi:hypothetical protein